MTRLEVDITGEGLKAEIMLSIARDTIKLLRAIERNITGDRTSKAQWRVDMLTGHSTGKIIIWCTPTSANGVGQIAWSEAMKRMRNATPVTEMKS